MADDSNTTPREQLCRLGYAELSALAARLTESAETVRNPAFYADLHQAAGAVSDLASTRFARRKKLPTRSANLRTTSKRACPSKFTAVIEFMAELLGLISKPVEP